MIINVDPDLGAIVSLLQYKIDQRGFTEAQIQKELEWKGSLLRKLLSREQALRLDHLLQILAVIDVDPIDFFLEAYGQPRTSRDFKTELREELVRLLHENLTVFTDPQPLPRRGREPLANHLELDLELLEEPVAGARNLIAAVSWMMKRLPLEERHLLVGLCERTGSFEAGIGKADELLAVAGTAEGAAWAMEHQSQLIFDKRDVEDLDGEVNLDAVLFLIDLELKAGHRQAHLDDFVKVREQLKAIQQERADEE